MLSSPPENRSSTRLLLLAYERPPHPDAVVHPAAWDDVRLGFELLGLPYAQRLNFSEQLRRYLAQQDRLPSCRRPLVSLRRPSGLCLPIAWRFAQWLAHTLLATDSARDRVRAQMSAWLGRGDAPPVVCVQRECASVAGWG